MLPAQRKALIILHLCVFIWGFTAILGELISLPETLLVWYRMGITSLSLLFIPAFWRSFKHISPLEIWKLSGIGILVAIHWITFYGSIKYATASVALTCLATTSFFTSLAEPLLTKTPFNLREILFGLAMIPALYLVYYFSGQYTIGIIMGIISAVFAAIFTVLNKKATSHHPALSITFLELGTGFVFISALLPIYLNYFPVSTIKPIGTDLVYLLVLSLVCTTLPFILSLISLRHISAFTANLTINLEPIYGMLLAAVIFKEHKLLHTGFYIGAGIILLLVFLQVWWLRKFPSTRPDK